MADVRVHAFHGGGEIADMSVFDPFHPEVGTKVEIPYFFYVVTHPNGNVLFDTGGHPSLINDPRARLGEAADAFEVTMEEGDDVVSQLEAAGFAPSDIDHVVLSHLHYDHAGGIEFFTESTFYAQRRELEFAHWPPVYQREIYLPADFDHPVEWVEVEGDLDLFDDGRIVLFPTPGHTAGHQSMLVRLDEGRSLILVADAAYLPRNIDENVLPGIVWNPDAMVSSWRRIRRLQRHDNAELIFTHDLEWPQKTLVAPERCYE
ncbi:MAG TPA: N-acyl homoserine lactonase family protein [Solirubrobacterales bacterium]|jgi:glyoxylase-like metal-dependent hydrolase (beta-lactamase superfamily II)